ncbi:MAG: hypothetical protein PHV30_03710 [Candidatus Margulisbacteria bacterium]|nr:hypothetical protein [Candidatus Margulisiibacteriota bacterium]
MKNKIIAINFVESRKETGFKGLLTNTLKTVVSYLKPLKSAGNIADAEVKENVFSINEQKQLLIGYKNVFAGPETIKLVQELLKQKESGGDIWSFFQDIEYLRPIWEGNKPELNKNDPLSRAVTKIYNCVTGLKPDNYEVVGQKLGEAFRSLGLEDISSSGSEQTDAGPVISDFLKTRLDLLARKINVFAGNDAAGVVAELLAVKQQHPDDENYIITQLMCKIPGLELLELMTHRETFLLMDSRLMEKPIFIALKILDGSKNINMVAEDLKRYFFDLGYRLPKPEDSRDLRLLRFLTDTSRDIDGGLGG